MTTAADIRGLEAASLSMELSNMGLKVDGTPFDLSRYPYLIELFDEEARYVTILKGGQMGFTSTMVLKFIAGAARYGLRGVIIFFPSHREAGEFCTGRIDPMLAQPALRGLVRGTDTQGLKMIRGCQFYLRGVGPIGASTKGSKGPVKSIPADWIAFDEMDEMMPSRIDEAEYRLSGSQAPRQWQLSTPTLPMFGVDLEFQDSDKRRWHWRCDRCNTWQCLDLEYPDCIAIPTGKEEFYICKGCRDPLVRWRGEFVAEVPSITEHRGYAINQLNSPTRSAHQIISDRRRAEKRGRLTAFINQTLGEPHADIQDMLTKILLDRCLGREPRELESPGPCVAAIDLGRDWNHYMIGGRQTEDVTRILTYGTTDSMNELESICKRFNVRAGVIDQQAETHTAREWIASHNGWWGCEYVEHQAGDFVWNQQDRVVKMHRTVALDASHAKILNKDTILPRADDKYLEMFVPQMCNLGKTRQTDPETGKTTVRYVILGKVKNDHLRHCHAMLTACERKVGLLHRGMRKKRGAARRSGRRSAGDYGFMAS